MTVLQLGYSETKQILRNHFGSALAAAFIEEDVSIVIRFVLEIAVEGIYKANTKQLMLMIFRAVELSGHSIAESSIAFTWQDCNEMEQLVQALILRYDPSDEPRHIVRAFESLPILHTFMQNSAELASGFLAALLEKKHYASVIRLLPFLWRFSDLEAVFREILTVASLDSASDFLQFLARTPAAMTEQGLDLTACAEQTLLLASSLSKFSIACQLCELYGLDQHLDEARQGMKTERIAGLLRGNKWQLALRAANEQLPLVVCNFYAIFGCSCPT